jgi:phosphohistidine phosphatase
MLTLILFRHGKSDWDKPFANDHDRPLAHRGKEAARCMGRLLHQAEQVPDLAICSSAVRARDTLQLAARAGHWHCAMRVDSDLYEASSDTVVRLIRAVNTPAPCLLLTGHEPTFSELASRLIGKALMRLPTASMTRIDFECDDWEQVEFGQGQLRWLLPPKTVCRLKLRK